MKSKRDNLILEYLSYAKGIAFRICLRKNCYHLLDDCQSVGLEALVKAVDSYKADAGASLKTWIIRSVKFAILNFLKKENKNANPTILDVDDFTNSICLSVNGIENQIKARSLIFKLLYYVSRHKASGRKINAANALLNHYFDGQLMKEIAEHEECTVANVSSMISEFKRDVLNEFQPK